MGSPAGKWLAFLFDLDLPLVDPSPVAHLRAAKLWPQVMRSLDAVVTAVPPKPGQTRDRFTALFDELKPLLSKGVILSFTRSCA